MWGVKASEQPSRGGSGVVRDEIGVLAKKIGKLNVTMYRTSNLAAIKEERVTPMAAREDFGLVAG